MTRFRLSGAAVAALMLGAVVAACTPAQRDLVGIAIGVPVVAKATQCAKPLDQRRREWEATGRKITPLDCDSDGHPDFGAEEPAAPSVPVPPAPPAAEPTQ